MENEEKPELEQEEIEEEEEEETETPEGDETDYKALYEAAERKRKKLKRKLYSKEAEEKVERQPITTNSDAKWKSKMELKVEGYNDEEVEFILKNGGKKALESPYIKKTIEVMREQKTAEAAMIDDTGSKSTTEKRLSPEAFSKLSAEEQRKVLSDFK